MCAKEIDYVKYPGLKPNPETDGRTVTLGGLKRNNYHMFEYIDKRIREHNNVVIMRECPSCGAHEFITGDHVYTCAFCGNSYNYLTLLDKESNQDAE